LIHVVNAGGTVLLDGIPVRLAEGDSLLVLPFQFHHYADLESRRLRWLFLSFEVSGGSGRLESLRFRVWRPSEVGRALFREAALLWCRLGFSASDGEVLATVDRLLARALFEMDVVDPRGARSRKRRTWTEEAEAVLRRSLDDDRTLEEAARSLGMSVRNLRIRFRRETGISPAGYRANYRLHRALALLRETDLPIGTVAGEVGFASQPAFNRFVKLRTGRTPSALRRMDRHPPES
jgi:AraC-like DNA-binding protein